MLYPAGENSASINPLHSVTKPSTATLSSGVIEKKIRNMPERDYDQVALTDGVAVPAGIAEHVLHYNIISEGIAERTLQRLHASNPRTSI
jgi:hypothetical protein